MLLNRSLFYSMHMHTHTHTHTHTGKDMDQLWEDLGVADDVKYVSSDRLFQIYHDYMGSVEQQCLSELEELLLEHHDIFDKNISSEADMITKVSEELRVSYIAGESVECFNENEFHDVGIGKLFNIATESIIILFL